MKIGLVDCSQCDNYIPCADCIRDRSNHEYGLEDKYEVIEECQI